MNKVFLTGRLTRDPEMRSLASGRNVTTVLEVPLRSKRILATRWTVVAGDSMGLVLSGTGAEGQRRIVVKRISLLAVVAFLGLLVSAPVVQAAPPTTAFTGQWEAVDPLDGSNLDASFFGGNSVQILYTDDGAPVTCGDPSNQFFTSLMIGKVDGNEVSSTIRWARCGTVNLHFNGVDISWNLDDQGDADPSNDVLTNSFGEIFSRAA